MRRARENLTLDFFEIPTAPAPTNGSMDYSAELCATLTEMIADAMKDGVIRSRHDLAARMSELTGHEISKSMIDAWTAESKEAWRFPFQFAAALEVACESTRLQELLGRKRGSRILVGKEVLLAEMGRVQQAKADIAAQEKALKKRMAGIR
jgi:hypothetical protein